MVQTQSKLLEKFEVSQNKDITQIIFFLEPEEEIFIYLLYLYLDGDQPDAHPDGPSFFLIILHKSFLELQLCFIIPAVTWQFHNYRMNNKYSVLH